LNAAKSAAAAVVIAFAALMAPGGGYAAEVAEKVAVSGSHQDQQFLAGETVEVTADIADDVFAAGRKVLLESASAENALAAGFFVTVRETTARDMILAGGEIDFAGAVSDDLVAAVCPVCPMVGGLHLRRGTHIGDDARLAGRDIHVEARIDGTLYAAATGTVTLSGEIAGSAEILADRIVVTPDAKIGGDLLYAGTAKPEIPEGAVVSGEVRELDVKLPKIEDSGGWVWFGIAVAAIFVLAVMFLGAVYQLVIPNILSRAAVTAQEHPWSSLGRGVVVLLVIPALAGLLLATVIGIPLAMVIMAIFFVMLTLAFVSVAYCIGLFIRDRIGRSGALPSWAGRIMWTALGIAILMLVAAVPLIGFVVALLAVVAGLGGLVGEARGVLQPQAT